MSKFIGVKMVEAVPMTAQTAKLKGYKVSTNHYYTNNNSQDKHFIDYDFTEGYEVTYPNGYKSWCPKDVFEASYFGLNENNDGAKILKEDVEAFVVNVDVMTVGNKTTVVNAHTLTGFDMIRHSSCVDSKNYNQELGKEYAMEEVVNNLWAKYGIKPRKEVLPPHVQRMIEEHKEVEQRLTKLSTFIDFGANFKTLEVEEQERLKKQRVFMDEYFHILDERLAYAFKSLNINK